MIPGSGEDELMSNGLGSSVTSGDSKIIKNLFDDRPSSSLIARPRMNRFGGRNVIPPPSIVDGTSDNEDDFRISNRSSIGTLSTHTRSPLSDDPTATLELNPLSGSGGTFTVWQHEDVLTPIEAALKFTSPRYPEIIPIDYKNPLNLDTVSDSGSNSSETRKLRKVSKVFRTKNKTTQEDLAEAVIEGNVNKIEEILDVYIAINGESGFRIIMGYKYNFNPQTQVVKPLESSLIRFKQNCTDHYNNDLNILELACIFNQEHVILLLTLYGVSKLRVFLEPPYCPLHVAAYYKSLTALKELIKLGGDVDAPGNLRETPLHVAARKGNQNILKFLLSAGASIDAKNGEGSTPLHVSVENYMCMRTLVDNGAQVNCRDSTGSTPLHLAIDPLVVSLLMENRADPVAKNLEGKNVLEMLNDTAPESLWCYFDHAITRNSYSLGAEKLEVRYDMSLLEKSTYYSSLGLLSTLIKENNIIMLKHPLLEILIHIQDTFIGTAYRRVLILFYGLFLGTLTVTVLINHGPSLYSSHLSISEKNSASLTLLIFSSVFLVVLTLLMWRQLISMFRFGMKLVWLLNGALFFTYFLLVNIEATKSGSYTVQIGTASVFLSWAYFTNILGQIPAVGIYILMVEKISINISKFLLIYLCAIFAFVISFHILFSHDERFNDPVSAIMGTLVMMVGEYEYKNLFSKDLPHPGLSHVIFFLFFLFVTIVIINLLVGLAISNITEIFQEAGVNRLKLTTVHLLLIEDLYRICLRHVFSLARFDVLVKLRKKLHFSNSKSSTDEPLILYSYPNKGKQIYLKLECGTMMDTGFALPDWIINNTRKVFERKAELVKQTETAIAAERDDNDSSDAHHKALKSDLKHMKKDLRVLMEIMRVKMST